jgi:hypothetical protein
MWTNGTLTDRNPPLCLIPLWVWWLCLTASLLEASSASASVIPLRPGPLPDICLQRLVHCTDKPLNSFRVSDHSFASQHTHPILFLALQQRLCQDHSKATSGHHTNYDTQKLVGTCRRNCSPLIDTSRAAVAGSPSGLEAAPEETLARFEVLASGLESSRFALMVASALQRQLETLHNVTRLDGADTCGKSLYRSRDACQ